MEELRVATSNPLRDLVEIYSVYWCEMTFSITVVDRSRWGAKEGRFHNTKEEELVSRALSITKGMKLVYSVGAEPNQEARVSNNISLHVRKTILNEWTGQRENKYGPSVPISGVTADRP